MTVFRLHFKFSIAYSYTTSKQLWPVAKVLITNVGMKRVMITSRRRRGKTKEKYPTKGVDKVVGNDERLGYYYQ